GAAAPGTSGGAGTRVGGAERVMPRGASANGKGPPDHTWSDNPTASPASGCPVRSALASNAIVVPSRAGACASTASSGGAVAPAHAVPNAADDGRAIVAVHSPRPSRARPGRRGSAPGPNAISSQTTFAGPSLLVDQLAPASSLVNTPTSVAA